MSKSLLSLRSDMPKNSGKYYMIFAGVMLLCCLIIVLGGTSLADVMLSDSVDQPSSFSDTLHIIIGPEVLFYLKVFCWVIGAMFAALTAVSGGLAWFFKRTLDKLDGTNDRQWEEIVKNRSDIDKIVSEHNLRGTLCPGLRPDILREVVASILGIALPEVRPHHRVTDPPTVPHVHARGGLNSVDDGSE